MPSSALCLKAVLTCPAVGDSTVCASSTHGMSTGEHHLQTKDQKQAKTGKEQMAETEKSRTEDKTLSDSHLAQEPWTHGWNI